MQTNPMMFIRSLKGAPASVLWTLVLVHQLFTIKQMSDYTRYKPDAIRDAMRVLGNYGLVAEQKRAHGESVFTLTERAQYLLPGLNPGLLNRWLLPNLQNNDVQNPIKPNSDQNLIVDGVVKNSEKSDSGTEFVTQNPEKSNSGTEILGSSLTVDVDESIKPKHHQQQHLEPENRVRLVKILENCQLLFEDYLSLSDIPDTTSADLALAWVSKIWTDVKNGNSINNPMGLLRSRLQTGSPRKLQPKLLDQLPPEYRQAIGLPVDDPLPPYSHERLEKVIEETRSQYAMDDSAIRARNEQIRSAVDEVIRRAWIDWMESLDCPRAWHENWFSDTIPLEWNGRSLIVGARNEYAANWLSNRFKICTILGTDANVEFVAIDNWLSTYQSKNIPEHHEEK